MKKIAILASGSGTNAENIIKYFNGNSEIEIDSVWSNRKDAYVLERAKQHGIEYGHFTKDDFSGSDNFLNELESRNIDLIVLAGFLLLIPPSFINKFPIINIHPALLPSYGGKGMYGSYVHEAVIKNKEKESGITIHLVNEEYDKGEHLFQAKCAISPSDTPDSLAANIHKLEHKHFPKVIEEYLSRES
jgi:phosphoribosylglycinamide formyltransferase-1